MLPYRFLNWIPDSSIISIQPEGSTRECPSCYKEGTFTLRPFDDKTLSPTSDRKMAIHIPVVAVGNRLYSYWLSYQTGVDGLAQIGLSVHLAWFRVHKFTHFGSQYDSLRFDAFGDTNSMEDSFVLENTCYHISPPGYLRDQAIAATDLVQPVVCVDSLDVGTSITVSVSFIEKQKPPLPLVKVDQIIELQCSADGATSGITSLDGLFYNLIHVQNTGNIGEVTISLCTSSGEVKAYFYDEYVRK